MKNKQIVAILMGIVLINLVGAVDMFSGDTYELELGEVPAYYEITQNTTSIEVTVTYDGTKALITPNKYMSGSFTITFYNSKDEPIHHYSGGGGGGIDTDYEQWQCDDWSACINEKQTRMCTDLNHCGTTDYKPVTSRDCSFEPDEGIETFDDSPNVFSRITGAVIGTLGTGGTIAVSVFVLGILGSLIVITKVRKKR